MSPFMKCSCAAALSPRVKQALSGQNHSAQRGGRGGNSLYIHSQKLKSLLIGINQLFINLFMSISSLLDGCQICVTLGLDRCQSDVGF